MAAFSFSPDSSQIKEDFHRIPIALDLLSALSGQHLFLTGGTGFFGRWLLAFLAYLNSKGACIAVTVLSRAPAVFLEAQPYYRDLSWLHWLQGDIRDFQMPSYCKPDLILHAAADTSMAAHAKPLDLFDTIVVGARRVLQFAVNSGVRRVLFTGSGAQYGALSMPAVTEEYQGACYSNVTASVYGEAKRAQEVLAAIYAESHGLEIVLTRCFAFSGPGLPLDGHFAIGNFVRDALDADAIVVQSDGQSLRSYLHGSDLAAWLLKLLVSGKSGQAYNVGSDHALSIADLANQVLARVAPHKAVRILGQTRAAERSSYVPEISRARALGLDVWTSLDLSIDSMANWAKQVRCV